MLGPARRTAIAILLPVLTAAGAAEGVKLRPLPAIEVDDKGSGLLRPEAVAFDGRSLLVVADTGNGRLVRYTVTGERVVPSFEIRLAAIPRPIRIQIGPGGELFALDGKLRKIARLSSSGEFKGYVEPAADALRGPVVPRSFVIDREGNLFLLDISQDRILVLDAQGRTARQITFPPGERSFSDLAVDGGGTVYAIQSIGRRVFVARRQDAALAALTGPLKEDLAFPAALAVDERGRLFIADQNGGGIVILGTDGSFRGRQSGQGWKEGFLRYPSGLCAGGGNLLFVADRGNNRIEIFTVSE